MSGARSRRAPHTQVGRGRDLDTRRIAQVSKLPQLLESGDILVKITCIISYRNAAFGKDALELETTMASEAGRTCKAGGAGRIQPDRKIKARLFLSDAKIVRDLKVHTPPLSLSAQPA